MSFEENQILIHGLSDEPVPLEPLDYDIREPQNLEQNGKTKSQMRNPFQLDPDKKIMVCVTRQKNCERLIRHGAEIANVVGSELLILHAVVENDHVVDSEEDCETLEYLFSLANEHNAEMQMIRCQNALDGIADTALKNNVGLIVLGTSPSNALSLHEQIKSRLPNMNFIVLAPRRKATVTEEQIA